MFYEDVLPNFIMYGAGREEIIYGTPKSLKCYKDAFIKKREIEAKTADINAWISGIYISQAVASCFSKSAKYPKSPMFSAKSEEKEKLSDAERFGMFADQFNASHNFND